MTDTDESPGWDAIDAVLGAVHPGVEPYHVGYTPGVHFGSGLQGCSAYAADGHWHYVTYGLTELWLKAVDTDPQTSGWGFELTMRVPRTPEVADPPPWPFNLLEQVARFVREQGVLLGPGHRMDTRHPITGAEGTRLTALAFAPDPWLATIDTPNGRVEFLQAVGLTAGELARAKETSTDEVLAELSSGNPLLITDPRRVA